jgi:hypothetical protein
MRQVMLACAVIAATSTTYAQAGQRGDGPVPFVPGTRVAIESEVVRGAPYSAEVVNDSVQALTDGNRISRHTVARVYRDSEGRTRREVDRRDGTSEISIHDPVAQTSWMLDNGRHTARQLQGAAVLRSNDAARALEPRVAEQQVTVFVNGQPQTVTMPPTFPGTFVGLRDQQTEEHLAPRTIEGLRVDGIRRTQTIAAGAIGNERPIVVTTEEWTSPELKVLVLSEHTDPRNGTSTYKLVKVSRADPPTSLFQVPADYTIVTSGRGGERGAPGQR